MRSRAIFLAGLLALTGGCAVLEPELPVAEPAVPEQWPTSSSSTQPVVDVPWPDFFADASLQTLIGQALENNRDLRIAVLNVEKARAQYRIQRAERVPSVGVAASMQRGRTSGGFLYGTGGDSRVTEYYTADLGITGFELDLFGRVRNLTESELQTYLATEEARRTAQLALIAEVATAYLTLAADRELKGIASETFDSYQSTFELTEKRYALGAASALEVNQARTAVESARAELARYSGRVARDTNALRLLVGGPLDPALVPDRFEPLAEAIEDVPAGLPSELLLRRPDVMAAEHALRAANARIGAARAAFFPSISLTGSVGSASPELSGLFESGTRTWLFMPQVNVPIFQGGRLTAGLEAAKADRDIRLAEYERAIQAGFREVADGLALGGTLREQRLAQEALVAAATRAYDLSVTRYEAGRDSYLPLLVAQRTLMLSRQTLVGVDLAEQVNRIDLYKALGGGWPTEETE